MRRLFVVVAGGLGLGVVWRRLRRRSSDDSLESDPAAELRAKLAETKQAPDEADLPPTPEDPAPAAKAYDPAARRTALHERARAAIDELG